MFSFEKLRDFTPEQVAENEAILKDEARFSALDWEEKRGVMQQYLYFQACKKSEALGETVDTSKKWKVFSAIKKNILLTRTLDAMVDEKGGKFSAEQVLAELNGNFLPDYAYGNEVGGTFNYRHAKGFNAYSNAVMNGSTEQFYKDWDAKTAEIKADEERRDRQYREAEERRLAEQKAKEEAKVEVKEEEPEPEPDPEPENEVQAEQEQPTEEKQEAFEDINAVDEEPEAKVDNEALAAQRRKANLIDAHIQERKFENAKIETAESSVFFAEQFASEVADELQEIEDNHNDFLSDMERRKTEREELFSKINDMEQTFLDESKFSKLEDWQKRNLMQDYLKETAHANPTYYEASSAEQAKMDITDLSYIRSAQFRRDIYNEMIDSGATGAQMLDMLNSKYVQKQAYAGFTYFGSDKKITDEDKKEWQNKLSTAGTNKYKFTVDIAGKRIERDQWQNKYIEKETDDINAEAEKYKEKMTKEGGRAQKVVEAKEQLENYKHEMALRRANREKDMLAEGITEQEIEAANKKYITEYSEYMKNFSTFTEAKLNQFVARNNDLDERVECIHRPPVTNLIFGDVIYSSKGTLKLDSAEREEVKEEVKAEEPAPEEENIKIEKPTVKAQTIIKEEEPVKEEAKEEAAPEEETIEQKRDKNYRIVLQDMAKKFGIELSEQEKEAIKKVEEKEQKLIEIVKPTVKASSIIREAPKKAEPKADDESLGINIDDSEIAREKTIKEIQNDKASISIGVLLNSTNAVLKNANDAKKGVWFGSGKYNKAASSLGKLAIALSTLKAVEENEYATPDAKTKALKAVKKETEKLKERIELYKQRKINDGNLSKDGKHTDKLLAHDKTLKRVNAMEWADELAKEIDGFVAARDKELNSVDKELLQKAKNTKYATPTLGTDEYERKVGLSDAVKLNKHLGEEANKVRREVVDKIRNGANLSTPENIKLKRRAVAKIMINEVMCNEQFRGNNNNLISDIMHLLPEMNDVKVPRFNKTVETMYYDPAFRATVDRMTDNELLAFMAEPTQLTKKYMNDPKRHKKHSEIENIKKNEAELAKQTAAKKNVTKTPKVVTNTFGK